jgi:hypothetical protein
MDGRAVLRAAAPAFFLVGGSFAIIEPVLSAARAIFFLVGANFLATT